MNRPIRVLVVDDSALMRKLIPQMLKKDPNIDVVGTAMDGAFALKKIEELKPDVVTLDLEMPRMDGMEALRAIMRTHRIPVIVVSAHSAEGAHATMKALAFGAFDFVTKPQDAAAGRMEDVSSDLAMKIKAAVGSHIPAIVLGASDERQKPARPRMVGQRPARVIGVGISTGGPNALQYVFSHLPEDFAGCLLVVQHMPEGFTEMLARRLNELSPLEVKEAQSGDLLFAGRALICPGNRHMKVRRLPQGDVAILSDQPKVNGHRPSADVLFHSMAAEFGRDAAAVIMTGMGEDGVEGIGAIKSAGGLTLAQTVESCVVSSMPRTAIDRGFVGKIASLEELPNVLHRQCSPDVRITGESSLAATAADNRKAHRVSKEIVP